jgi:protein-tyrosine phosphatase
MGLGMHSPRWIRLDGAINARDIGGVAGDGGRRIRTGRLFRSDHLDSCTNRDVALSREKLGIATVVDLRNRARERTDSTPASPFDAVLEVVNVALMADLEVTARRLRDPAVDCTGGFYLETVRHEQERIVQVIRAIARRCDRPVWFHCTSGKIGLGSWQR